MQINIKTMIFMIIFKNCRQVNTQIFNKKKNTQQCFYPMIKIMKYDDNVTMLAKSAMNAKKCY